MKTFGLILVGIVLFVGGYFLGSFRPVTGLLPQETIKGDNQFTVTILDSANQPVADLEVDVAEKNGPPTGEGVKKTNTSGVATFNLKPGHYFIFFNTVNFPVDQYQVPREMEIDIAEGQTATKTIILKNK